MNITEEQIINAGFSLVLPSTLYEPDIYTYDRTTILEYYPDKFVKVTFSQGFWAGLFGKANKMCLRLTTKEQFDAFMNLVKTLENY